MTTIKKHILTLVFLLLWLYVGAQQKFELTDALKSAYHDITTLKLLKGKEKIAAIKANDPSNTLVFYIENYIDFFTLFIQEEEKNYRASIKNRDIRLDRIKNGDKKSPYYLFCQAEILLQWAIIKLKFDDKINAALDVYEAYKLLEKNKNLFPEFTENNKSLSIIHALAESVPSWVRSLMGIKGSVALGTKEISELTRNVVQKNSMFKEEVIAIYSYILFYSNNRKEEAYRLYDQFQLNHKKSPLIAFLKSTMAQKIGKNEVAIKILEERPQGAEYMRFDYLDFMYGKFKLYRLDKDADIFMLKFLRQFKGRHYIKEAWQKLAWFHLIIHNDQAKYNKFMANCKSDGKALIDEDIQALNESKSVQIPHPILLKARLLYDGGYNIKCQNLLVLNAAKLIKSEQVAEYYYRLAKVHDALKNYVDALEYYDLTIAKSKTTQYYACSAALSAALIYELIGNKANAKIYFNKCLDLEPEGYSTSLHQKAKSGLDRL